MDNIQLLKDKILKFNKITNFGISINENDNTIVDGMCHNLTRQPIEVFYDHHKKMIEECWIS